MEATQFGPGNALEENESNNTKELLMGLWKTMVFIGALGGTAFTFLQLPALSRVASTTKQPYASNLQLPVKRSSADFLTDGDLSKSA